jgi:cell division protein FtsN
LLTHNDGLLIQEISSREEISLDHAAQKLQDSINQIRQELFQEGRIEIDGLGLLYLDKDYRIQFRVALKANLLPQSYGLRSFRFASVRNRKQTQTFEQEYMREPTGNRRTLVTTVAAASVLVLLGLTFFINHKLNEKQAAEASLISVMELKNDSVTEPGLSATSKPVVEEASTKKGHALQYKEVVDEVEYHIIAGSFSNMQSAQKFAKTLEAEGYSTTFVTDGDKVRVSIFSYQDRYEALKQLDFLRVTKDKTVWMLKHHKNHQK